MFVLLHKVDTLEVLGEQVLGDPVEVVELVSRELWGRSQGEVQGDFFLLPPPPLRNLTKTHALYNLN